MTSNFDDRPAEGGWFFHPTPPEIDASTRRWGLGWIGLIASLLLFAFFGGMALLILPLQNAVDIAVSMKVGAIAGVALAGVIHFIAVANGYRLNLVAWPLVALLFCGLTVLANYEGIRAPREALRTRVINGRSGEPEIFADAEVKEAFVKILDGFGQWGSPILYVRCKEIHEIPLSPELEADLAACKLDPAFRSVAGAGNGEPRAIPGAKLDFQNIGGALIARKLDEGFANVAKNDWIEFQELAPEAETSGKPVIDVVATTRLKGTFKKIALGSGREQKPGLAIDCVIDWKVEWRDAAGKVLCTKTYSTRPAKDLDWEALPSDIPSPYYFTQRSAHDNFARELLGRLGLSPGSMKTKWEVGE